MTKKVHHLVVAHNLRKSHMQCNAKTTVYIKDAKQISEGPIEKKNEQVQVTMNMQWCANIIRNYHAKTLNNFLEESIQIQNFATTA